MLRTEPLDMSRLADLVPPQQLRPLDQPKRLAPRDPHPRTHVRTQNGDGVLVPTRAGQQLPNDFEALQIYPPPLRLPIPERAMQRFLIELPQSSPIEDRCHSLILPPQPAIFPLLAKHYPCG
ncbi:hypothetical protein GCM10018954_026100 [Kutzneria kofuensis]